MKSVLGVWYSYRILFTWKFFFNLGNENIHEITSHGRYKLRVDLGDFENHFAYAEYSIFHVGDEMSKYQISVIGYSGTAGKRVFYICDHF